MPSNDQTRFATPSPVLAMLLWTVATTLLCAYPPARRHLPEVQRRR